MFVCVARHATVVLTLQVGAFPRVGLPTIVNTKQNADEAHAQLIIEIWPVVDQYRNNSVSLGRMK